MTNIFLAANYCNKLRTALANNSNVIMFINPDESAPFDLDQILLGGTYMLNGTLHKLQGYIFDYYFVPDTIIENKLFISVEVDIESIQENVITEFSLNIYVYTPKINVPLTAYTSPTTVQINDLGFMGNRIIGCCDAIDRLLKGSTEYGLGKVIPAPRGFMKSSAPTADYYGKRLSYRVLGYSPREVSACGN